MRHHDAHSRWLMAYWGELVTRPGAQKGAQLRATRSGERWPMLAGDEARRSAEQ